ncbi:MAG: hypothetical protein ACRD08_07855, partial [Acidimicrobiales bacterium]
LRVEPTGTGATDYTDNLDLPATGGTAGTPAYGGVFGIVPVTGRLALEPSLAGIQLAFPFLGSASGLSLGLRADVALTRNLYIAAGGDLLYLESSGTHDTQLGAEAAVGARFRIAPALSARIEAQATTYAKSGRRPPANAYALLLGLSAPVGGPLARRSRSKPRWWRPSVGITGGYARSQFVGLGIDLTVVAAPVVSAGAPPALFAVVPLAGREAVEMGLEAHRVDAGDSTTTSAGLGLRLNHALAGGWYAAAGGTLQYVQQPGGAGLGQLGVQLASGYRFRLVRDIGGRFEINYTMLKERTGLPAINTLGLMFGVMMRLN